MLRGLVVATAALVFLTLFLTEKLRLYRIQFTLQFLLEVSVFALIIIFHPELRRGLITLGQSSLFARFFKTEESEILTEIIKAVVKLSKNRMGALITIERDISLSGYIEGGIKVDSEVRSEILESIFHPGSALHDGAVVIRHNRIAAAGCLFPLSDNPQIGKTMGTRHRAGIGITEETDAISIIVSEETGRISAGVRGKLTTNLDRHELEKFLRDVYTRGELPTQAEVVHDATRKDNTSFIASAPGSASHQESVKVAEPR